MKVLILHQHFRTPHHGGAIRSYYLARALADGGVDTVVITGHDEPFHKTQIIEGVEIHYLPVPYNNRFGFYKRIRSFVQFAAQAVKHARKHKDADLCYAISVPLTTGLAALWIQRRYRIPFIFEVGDLWPDAPVQMGFIRNRMLQWLLFRMEKAIYKKAFSVVALSRAIQLNVESKVAGKAVHLLPNMADTGFFFPESKGPRLEEKFSVKGKFVVAYIGAIGVANGLDFLLLCARESQNAGLPVHFLLCGDGALLDTHQQVAANLGLSNLSFLPFRNRNGVSEIMNVVDAVFICYQPVKILETGSPNKYFDGLAAAKLIIINFGGWIKEEIESARCGIYIEHKNPKGFVPGIRPFIADPMLLKKYQDAARLLAETKYSREKLSARFCDLIREHIDCKADQTMPDRKP